MLKGSKTNPHTYPDQETEDGYTGERSAVYLRKFLSMEITLLIAKLLGVYFLVSGVFVITHQKTLGLLLREFFGNRAMTFIVGAILLLGGSLIVFVNEAGEDWLGLFVQVMGWAILIKGALYILAPEQLYKMVRPWSRSTLSLMGVTVAAIGAYLVFFLV